MLYINKVQMNYLMSLALKNHLDAFIFKIQIHSLFQTKLCLICGLLYESICIYPLHFIFMLKNIT